MPDAQTGLRYTRVIGALPPGRGGAPAVIRLGAPRISRNDMDWDTMEELLWCSSMTALAPGAARSGVTQFTTDRFIVDSTKVVRFMAGLPVMQVMSKGWAATKASRYQFRRGTTGDDSTFNLDGKVYVTEVAFSATVPAGNFAALAAPASGGRFSYDAQLLQAGTFQPAVGTVGSPIYGSIYVPGVKGWYIGARNFDVLADGVTTKTTTTWERWL